MAQLKDKYETLLLRRQGSRLYLTLNRPQAKNSITPKMIEELNKLAETQFEGVGPGATIVTVDDAGKLAL